MQRQKLGHRNGRSSCAHSIGKFFLCYIVLFSFETSATARPGTTCSSFLQNNCYPTCSFCFHIMIQNQEEKQIRKTHVLFPWQNSWPLAPPPCHHSTRWTWPRCIDDFWGAQAKVKAFDVTVLTSTVRKETTAKTGVKPGQNDMISARECGPARVPEFHLATSSNNNLPVLHFFASKAQIAVRQRLEPRPPATLRASQSNPWSENKAENKELVGVTRLQKDLTWLKDLQLLLISTSQKTSPKNTKKRRKKHQH